MLTQPSCEQNLTMRLHLRFSSWNSSVVLLFDIGARRLCRNTEKSGAVLPNYGRDTRDRLLHGPSVVPPEENVCGYTASEMSPKRNVERVRNGGRVTRSTRLDRASEIFVPRLAGGARGSVICWC